MRILHLSADYPDPLGPSKTRAISNLLAMASDHEHRVFSLNRVGWRNETEALIFSDAAGDEHRAVAYGAPPKGLLLKRCLLKLADWIAADCERAGFTPDLIHAHKLSVEGIAGEALAKRWRTPLFISSQGNSDTKIIGMKRGLRADYARIWREAAHVFPFAPWTADALGALLGPREGPVTPLPCPGPADNRLAPASASPVIRSAFHLTHAKLKNAGRLISAIAAAAEEIPDIRLEIIGGGDATAFASLSRIARAKAPGRVSFLGAVPNERVQTLFNQSCAFALVGHRESFGMVYAEALLAGTPCLYPRGRAIDGYFREGEFVLAADPTDEGEIAKAIIRLVREQDAFKARLKAAGEAGELDILRRETIAKRYLSALPRQGSAA